MKSKCILWVLVLSLFAPAGASAMEVGSDGTDGILSITSAGTTTINLSLAPTAVWTTPGTGTGVYDPSKWAVVFKYDSVYVATGKTVVFQNHPSGAPVVWLVRRGANIAGTVRLDGQAFLQGGAFAVGGPGGFRGGRSYLSAQSVGSAGLGPGGGGYSPAGWGSGGGYRSVGGGPQPGTTYGNSRVFPLLGGSGGAGAAFPDFGGGAGGGALLLASGRNISISGGISANGGPGYTYGNGNNYSGAGAGGGIRIVAEGLFGTVAGISAAGGTVGGVGGFGAIRIEADTIAVTGSTNPNFTTSIIAQGVPEIWPREIDPLVRILTVNGETVPSDPRGSLLPPGDFQIDSAVPVPVVLESHNVPVSWLVKVRVTLRSGDEYVVNATHTSGDESSSTWTATLQAMPVPDLVAIQARASLQ